MLRNRLRNRSSSLSRFVGRLLVVVVALALVWGGLVVVLLAAGLGRETLDSISGYRTAFDFVAGLGPPDSTARAIVAGAGVLALIVFGLLALRGRPRPFLARHDIELHRDERGAVTVEPRAVERIAEGAAAAHRGVAGASGRYGHDELAVGVAVTRARETVEVLEGAKDEIAEALRRHGLPAVPVNVVLTGYESKTRKELN